ncbi:MAG: elongation factor Ts [Clostridia bacterium]|nr:elongation factor Ts [Clostridia bacterium]MBQ3937875.1 elongation factor Ts [Clostridia bacterium]MBQ5487895.1 elongation factor Ts [Clostridia bacterium]MBR4636132.1 elongation factor Ts [Clostridia bacterium]
MEFTAKDVMALRERSGAGMMDCKKALKECDGDIEKAMDYLREKSLAASAKKASRIAAEGLVDCFVCDKCGVGVIIEVNCETDFVAKTDDFKALVANLAKHVAKMNPANVDEMMQQQYSEEEGKTVSDVINGAVAKIGEKITIRRFNRVEGIVDTYVHLGGKIGVLLQISNNENPAVAHDVSMQIAAAKPTCLCREDCDQADLDHEREILREQAKNDPKNAKKPEAIIEKMIEGRIEKYYKEVCLLEQPFVKNPDQTVAEMINGRFEVIGFTRFEMGEGLQKRSDNFADEVMAQTKKA